MWYFYFLKYAVFRRKTLVLYPKWCVQSDSEVRFRLTQQKWKKNDIFSNRLSFLTLKFNFFFRTLPVTGSDRNPYQATILAFVYALKKILGKYLVWDGRDGAPRFSGWKKKLVFPLLKIFWTNIWFQLYNIRI